MASYTPEERQAIAHAVLDDGLDAEEAVERAHAGLLEGVGEFEMSLAKAREVATRERQRRTKEELLRLEREEPGVGLTICIKGWEIVEAQMDALWAECHDGLMDSVHAVRLKRICRNAREVQRLSAACLAAIPPEPEQTNGSDGESLLRRLAAGNDSSEMESS